MTQEELQAIVKRAAPWITRETPEGVGYAILVWNRNGDGAAALGTNTTSEEFRVALRKLMDWAGSRPLIVPPRGGIA